MLALVVAMAAEARLLVEIMRPAGRLGGRPVYRGEIGGEPALLTLSGMGLVNAAQATTAVLEAKAQVTGVINLGCAGAYPDAGLAAGAAVLATAVVNADLGVQTSGRLHDIDMVGIPLGHDAMGRSVFNSLICDEPLAQRLAAGAPGLARGVCATVGRISGDEPTARAVATRWGALIEDMEAVAVAQVAAHYGKPFAVVRGVSNIAGRRELDVALGAEAAQRVVLAMAAAS